MPNISLEGLLRAKSDELNLQLGMRLGHPVSQGNLSEGEWQKFLRGFLPNRYAISKGYVYDSVGGVSDQIDIIIYDPFHSPLIYEHDGECYVTAESVYAVFEVKQTATKEHIEYADKKIESVIKLKRTSRGMINAGKPVPPRPLTHIIGGLLTTDNVDNPLSQATIKSHMACSDNIDIICSAHLGAFHRRGAGVGSIMASDAEESIFSFFYVILDELFQLGTVAAIDIRDYADKSLKSFKLERRGL